MTNIRFDDPGVVTVTWKPAGPLIVEGHAIILDNEGRPILPPEQKVPGQIKLCGCGMSGTKPFCDGSHKR
jgi:CDGSH-type Zn-finger protein